MDNGGKKCNATGQCVACLAVADCMVGTQLCQQNQCVPLTCGNIMKDGTETDIDCGGIDCAPCGTGKSCMTATDCINQICTNNKCQPVPTCMDGIKNQDETDVDCGGMTCLAKCADGKMCMMNSDCTSDMCINNACEPVCTDPAKDCPPPASECVMAVCENMACTTMNVAANMETATQTAGDCKHDICDGNGNVTTEDDDSDLPDDMNGCTTDTCLNGGLVFTPKPAQTACTDNGGKKCNATGQCVECLAGADCVMGMEICQQSQCVPSTCGNIMKDGTETDVDCGGMDCAPCGNGKSCLVAADCQSPLLCTNNKCQAMPTCMDGIKNQDETDVDCGGMTCAKKCDNGKMCMMNSDCASDLCVGNFCVPSGVGGAGGGGGAGGN
jgi:hypothetical protein